MNPEVLRYFHPILPSRKLRGRPLQAFLVGRPYVLFRDATGRAAALDDVCPHRHAPLSEGTVRPDGRLACPYHGWHFDGDGRGCSPAFPRLTRCNTRAYQVLERLGYLWLAHRETPLAVFPALEWDGYEFAGTVSLLVRAPLDVTLDNISEDEHFAYVHTTFGWDEEGLSQVRVDTVAFEDHSVTRYTGPQRVSSWAILGGVRAGDFFHNEWYMRFQPVHAVYTFGWRDRVSGVERPITSRAAVFLVPETATTTRIHMFLFLKIAPSVHRLLRRLMHWLARHIASKELQRDAWLIESVARAPRELRGMRLTRFDKAIIHNRKLLDRVYWMKGERQADSSTKSAALSRPAVD